MICDKQQDIALHKFTKPAKRRFFYARMALGIVVLLALFALAGCSDDVETYAAGQADLADAVAQAAKEAGK